MKRILVSLIILLSAYSLPSFALDGDDYMTFNVNGKEISALVPNKDTRSDFIELKKALLGDKISREALLGNKNEKFIFVGDDTHVRWIKLKKDGQELIEY